MGTGQDFTERCTIAIVGNGIAASIAAATLARSGCQVVQFASRARSGAPEILGCQTIQRLQQFGITVDGSWGGFCKGTLSLWGNEFVEHTDQALQSLQMPLSINSALLRTDLLRICAALGVRQVPATAFVREANTIYWRNNNQKDRSCKFDHVLVGAGRSSAFGPFGKARRVRKDKLVALTLNWKRVKRRFDLAVEAQTDGWWYAPPASGGADQIVFLSDPDLLPLGTSAKLRHLQEQFLRTHLMADLGSLDLNAKLIGVDAHSGFCISPNFSRFTAIGDAALSVDPLGGQGILYAIESGWFAGNELLTDADLGKDYSEWLREIREEQFLLAQTEYDKAIERFPRSRFWSRRRRRKSLFIDYSINLRPG